MEKVKVETVVKAPIAKVWEYYNDPKHITHWAFASDDWEAPRAENDLRVGGQFKTRMQAKDGSSGFDFGGIYTNIVTYKLIEYEFGDRHAKVEFNDVRNGVKMTVEFDPENENPIEMQRRGWQAILDNFKKYVEK